MCALLHIRAFAKKKKEIQIGKRERLRLKNEVHDDVTVLFVYIVEVISMSRKSFFRFVYFPI